MFRVTTCRRFSVCPKTFNYVTVELRSGQPFRTSFTSSHPYATVPPNVQECLIKIHLITKTNSVFVRVFHQRFCAPNVRRPRVIDNPSGILPWRLDSKRARRKYRQSRPGRCFDTSATQTEGENNTIVQPRTGRVHAVHVAFKICFGEHSPLV